MSDAHEVPSESELRRLQLQLTNDKLKAEAEKLKREAVPEGWWGTVAKHALAFGAVATVAATVYGIWDSYDKTITDREHARVADQTARFEDAIKSLESGGTISKLASVAVLSGYLNASHKDVHGQILFTFA